MRRHHKHHGRRRNHAAECRGSTFRERLGRATSSQGFFRSRQGLFMGVCKGLADHFNTSVFWTRAIVLIMFLFTGFWPVGVLYIVAGLILRLEPAAPIRNERDEEFYNDFTHSRESAINRIRRKYENIERRIQRMEDHVTSREFNWR